MDDKTKLALIKAFVESSLEFNQTADEHAAVLNCILDVIEFGEGEE